ncbi:MAG: EF-hand domain-containing protein [Rhodobacteraceae bacterium]|nr:EF-hand domain-containing protein [Paracoccaceae bacterium]
MKKILLALGTVSALAVTQAQAETAITDTDGNGTYSYEELKAAFPDLTEETFKAADTNGDGQLDADELKAAQEAGNIPT